MKPRGVCTGPVLLLLFALLAGCTLTSPTPTLPPPTPSPVPTPTPDPRIGGRFTVRLSHEIERLTPLAPADDPEAGWVMAMLYAGLTRLDDHGLPQPDLAESWTVAANGLLVTFTLRPDLRWSDGSEITAEDVRFTWQAMAQWDVRSAAQADQREYVAAVLAPAGRTVVFVLNRRLADILTDAAVPILPRHVWGKHTARALLRANLLENPVGSGPFLLQERRPGQALLLGRNPFYHGPAPFLDQVAFLVAPDAGVAEQAVRRGDLMLAGLPRQNFRSLVAAPPDRPLFLVHYPARQYTFVGFHTGPGSLFEDVRLRQAWALALDKEALVSGGTDEGTPLWSPILPPSWAYDPEVPRLDGDPQQARDLLAAAGWRDEDGDGVVEKDGRPLRVRLFVRGDAPERVAACQRMAASLAQVGISVEVIPADFQSVIAAKMRPPYDFDALCMQWRNLGADPDLFYLFHSSQAWQGEGDERENLYNFVGYRSAEADRLILSGRDSYSPERRMAAYKELQRLLALDVPYYMLWADPVYLVAEGRLATPEGPVNLETPYFLWNVERWYVQR